MNYIILSKIYQLCEGNKELCEFNSYTMIFPKNYEELKNKMLLYNYDVGDTFIIDIKIPHTEEATASADHPDKLLLTDGTYIKYGNGVIIREFCSNTGEIIIKDEGLYCSSCFEKINKQLCFRTVKKILLTKDETYGLSTSKKIEYILINSSKKMSASEIYKNGEPWDLKTFTPRNSVYARVSSLYKEGIIKRDGHGYWI